MQYTLHVKKNVNGDVMLFCNKNVQVHITIASNMHPILRWKMELNYNKFTYHVV